jgi:hypothetical protein
MLTIFLSGVVNISYAQSTDSINQKTVSHQIIDSIRYSADSFFNKLKSMPGNIKNEAVTGFKTVKQKTINSLRNIRPDSAVKTLLSGYSLKGMSFSKPFVQVLNGSVTYNLFYRSSIDTPFFEKNSIQHNSYGAINASIGMVPLRVNYLLRRTNSQYYNNINDIQVEFDPASFTTLLKGRLKDKVNALIENSRDSLLELNYKMHQDKLKNLGLWMNNPLNGQKLSEAYEMLNVPGLAYNSTLPDTINLEKEATLKNEAKQFIEFYNKNKEGYDKIKGLTDTLSRQYEKMLAKITALKDIVSQKLNGNMPVSDITRLIEKEGLGKAELPAKYKWLMNTRKFSLGRTQLNQSELTTKNIGINGIHYEYNSWFYFSFTAGSVNYRFRDFAFNQNKKNPQYLVIGRLGIGNIYKNYFIVSVFKGKKQLYTTTNNYQGLNTIEVKGMSLEAKYRVTSTSYISGEVAQSISPDFRNNPATTPKVEFKEKINKAFTVKGYTYFPKTRSLFEGMYKFTGGNFQSFTTLQTNAETRSWYVKGEQSFFNRKLKVLGSLRKNDFSNPYILQRYSSNTLYKSLQAVLRARKWPTISIGYIPVAQITAIDSQLVENNFQSINATLSHSFLIGSRRANTVFTYNKFYNTEADTSLLYYNALNIMGHITVSFDHFDLEAGGNHSVNTNYQLEMLEGGMRLKLFKSFQGYFGFKVNNFNQSAAEVGAAASIQFNSKRLGAFNLFYDNGFIPTNNKSFIRNEMLNICFTKFF